MLRVSQTEVHLHPFRIFLTFDGLVKAVPVLPGGEVGWLVLGLPQENALVLRSGADVFAIMTVK